MQKQGKTRGSEKIKRWGNKTFMLLLACTLAVLLMVSGNNNIKAEEANASNKESYTHQLSYTQKDLAFLISSRPEAKLEDFEELNIYTASEANTFEALKLEWLRGQFEGKRILGVTNEGCCLIILGFDTKEQQLIAVYFNNTPEDHALHLSIEQPDDTMRGTIYKYEIEENQSEKLLEENNDLPESASSNEDENVLSEEEGMVPEEETAAPIEADLSDSEDIEDSASSETLNI